MKLIAHRGNINGQNSELENKPEYILKTISLGYDCEIDIRYINNTLYLGHDIPQYEISINFLLSNYDKLWIHCKNMEALDLLINYKDLNIFWHENDSYTITSKQYIWSYVGMPTTKNIICVMPELHNTNELTNNNFFAICTDNCLKYQNINL
jgi:hypothetical protein